MTNLLAELERVRGLVADYDALAAEYNPAAADAESHAGLAAMALFDRPDFLALIEALREPVAWRFRVRDCSGPWVFAYELPKPVNGVEVVPLYALPTKERDDG